MIDFPFETKCCPFFDVPGVLFLSTSSPGCNKQSNSWPRYSSCFIVLPETDMPSVSFGFLGDVESLIVEGWGGPCLVGAVMDFPPEGFVTRATKPVSARRELSTVLKVWSFSNFCRHLLSREKEENVNKLPTSGKQKSIHVAGPRIRFPRNIFWKLVFKSACKQVNLRSTKGVNNLTKYARLKLPLNSLIKLSEAFFCLKIEDIRQMACSQPNLILHTAHPNTFGKFVAPGGFSAPHCIEIAVVELSLFILTCFPFNKNRKDFC